MKKQMKRLALNRETLHGLEESNLQRVVGASDGTAIACVGSHCLNASCNSCNTCGTRLC